MCAMEAGLFSAKTTHTEMVASSYSKGGQKMHQTVGQTTNVLTYRCLDHDNNIKSFQIYTYICNI